MLHQAVDNCLPNCHFASTDGPASLSTVTPNSALNRGTNALRNCIVLLCVPVAGASSWFFGAIQFPSAYSNPSAPGLLVASGNVAPEGYGLDDNDG